MLIWGLYELSEGRRKGRLDVSDDWYKNKESDVIWWKDTSGIIGVQIFSFDKKQEFNLFADYPHNMTAEQVRIFDKENSFWAEFFKDRK